MVQQFGQFFCFSMMSCHAKVRTARDGLGSHGVLMVESLLYVLDAR